jgi:hypothetical protein
MGRKILVWTSALVFLTPLLCLASDGLLSVTPADGFHSEALPGNSFDPPGKTYILQNTGTASIDWTVTNASAAFVVSKTAGTLLPGQVDVVTVTANASYSFTPGVNCSDTIHFNNVTNTQGNTSRVVDAVVIDTKGDVNGDRTVNLGDAIFVLELMIGMEPPGPLHPEGDVNGDGKIDMNEVLYILQKAAGLR